MPNPAIQDVHIDSVLTEMSLAFMQGEDNFVADRVFPFVGVEKKTDKYFTYNQGDFWRNQMQKRAPGTESVGGGYRLSTDTYSADVFALHVDIDDQTEANYDDPLDAEIDAMNWLSQQALIAKDKLWVADYFTTGKWTTDQTGAASVAANQFIRWSTAGSTPIEDLRAQKAAIKARTGFEPNTLVLGYQVWNVLADHAEIIARMSHSERSIFGPDLLAAILGLDRVVIASGLENTAAEGQTDAYSFIAGKHALLVYAAPRPGLRQPSGGYTFGWKGLLGSNAMGGRIAVIPTPLLGLGSRRVEFEMAFDFKRVAADLGVFFNGAVA